MVVRVVVHLLALVLGTRVFRLPPTTFADMVGPALDRTLWFGLFACVFLYLALLVSPMLAVFPRMPGRDVWVVARRALGIDAAIFAALHGWYGFYGWVGGFEGLASWSWDYNLSLLLGTVACGIVAVLAVNSFDLAVAKLARWWKPLHRLVYLAGLLVVAHAAIVTIHILDLKPFMVAWFLAIAVLLLLEFIRVKRHVAGRVRWVVAPVFGGALAALYWSTFLIGHHRH